MVDAMVSNTIDFTVVRVRVSLPAQATEVPMRFLRFFFTHRHISHKLNRHLTMAFRQDSTFAL